MLRLRIQQIVLQPDLTALFKARGKKHSKGGMQVNLRPNSFIFSDDKSLAFDEEDHDLFELKKGGNFNKGNNTPASVLKRNIDVKHYNTIVNNIQDVKKDDLTKKSSSLMLDKYVQTLGNIAFAQEGKKDFPDGVPEFATGTAPVYDTNLKESLDQQKQFAKYGGIIGNPYMSMGGYDDNPCPCGKNGDGTCVEPCSEAVYNNILKTKAPQVAAAI